MLPRAVSFVIHARGVLPLVIAGLLAGCAAPRTDPGEASPAIDSATAGLPTDPNALVLGAEVALQRQQYREAAQAYVRAARLATDESLAEQATRVAYEHHQWTLVLDAAERWLELNQTNEEARRFAAFAALHLYQIDRAAGHLSFLLDTAFINPQAGFLALLPQLSDEGSAAATTAVMQQLVLKFPDLTEAHYALGRAALQSDNFALALTHAQKAHELGPFWSPAGLLLAQVQLIRGDADAALATARQIVQQDGQDSYRLEYALMLLQAGKDKEGRAELTSLAGSESAAAVAERALADIDFQMGDRESAKQRYSTLLSSGRFVYESLFYLGAIAESRESWDEAVQIYSRVTGGELAVPAQSRAAQIKMKQGGGVKAGLAHLEEFGATRPQYALDIVTARANLLANSGDRAGALALLDAALKEYPDSSELRFARIFQLEAADKVDQSIAELRRLVADRPNDPAATNALGYTLVDRKNNHREGFKYISQALAQTPDNGAVLDSMGWALHRQKKNEDALEHLEHARRRINDPEVDVHLAQVLLALGRKDEAVATLKEADERFPDNPKVQKLLKTFPN
jgi:tetratricopeptide (TPR) repeat protein